MSNDIERMIRDEFQRENFQRVATLVVEHYGPEVLGWMVTTTSDPDLSEEAFAAASEDLWQAVPSFGWECSIRTWFYILARNALSRVRAQPNEELKEDLEADVVVGERTRTRPWLRTDVKDRFRAMRDALDEHERELLVLRVDRRLRWNDIARVLQEPGDIQQASARVRKRFSLLKAELRLRAEKEGLLFENPI